MRRKNGPFAQMSLRTKLITSYLLLLLLPMTMLGGFAYASIGQLLVAQSQSAYEETLRQAALGISSAMDNHLVAASAIQNNERLLSMLRILRIRELSPGEEYDAYRQLRAGLDTLQGQRGAMRVRLAVEGRATFVADLFDIFSMETLRGDAAYPALSAGRVAWIPSAAFTAVRVSDPRSLQLCLRVTDLSAHSTVLGVLLVEIDSATLFQPIDRLSMPKGGFVLLHDGASILHQSGANPAQADGLSGTLRALDETRYLSIEAPIGGHGWTLSMSIPRDSLQRPGDHLPRTILWMAAAMSTVGVVFALTITHSINKRLQLTLSGIRRMEAGELGVSIPVIGGDEYSRMQEAFNNMSLKTRQLVQDLYASQEQRKQAEMRLLYEQINPHFVYNTLDVIRWEAVHNGAKPLAELADKLVGYLRLSLNHGQEMIEVQREADLVASYMHIMNYRYQNAITFSVEIAPDIRDMRMIKMILQPLVENAVLHGIMGRREKAGSIRVKGWQHGGALFFTVRDDGAGMAPDRLPALLRPDETHYGLWNVQERLQAMYAADSGLRFASVPGKGTTVTVVMRGAVVPKF